MFQATVFLEGDQPAGDELLLFPNQNLRNGEREFTKEFGEISTLELDLLNVASAIFACDLAFKRGDREKIARQIELTIPVVNYAIFCAVREEIRFALLILSHDVWDIKFVPANGVPEPKRCWIESNPAALLLFSGGLDSFSAAIDLGDRLDRVELVSHVTSNPIVLGTQETLYSYLQEKYPGKFDRISFHISGRKSGDYSFPSDQEREESQRTRSFMFLSLAALTARRKGIKELVYIAENGQMAIHLPLTAARISAFSTYTAHPEFLQRMQGILQKVLSFPLTIQNPYLYKTKAEVVTNLVKNHREIIGKTVSCWKASRVTGAANHYGTCIPCLIRRIALESNGLALAEYKVDLLTLDVSSLDSNDDGKRNLAELGEFIKIFEMTQSQAELEVAYPELVNEFFDTDQAARMYQRFAHEARAVLNSYPTIKKFLG
ncbi:MAG: 7-cyano-7-deazaguanine synthase [Anaerolineaceae bacterium]|nr:7-cyano-7-deazaguanine synthase [Anaerolineaceae bacterium]